MAAIPVLILFSPNTIIRSAQVNTNNTNIRDTYNAHDIATTAVHGMVGGAVIVGTTMTQILAAKTFSDNLVFRSGTAFLGTFDHSNTADRIWTLPDLSGQVLLDTSPLIATVPPIGSIIAFQDFGGLVSFNTTYWKAMDGTAIVSGASPLNGQTAQDMSNRYLVGFGTEGGGDINTAPWATGAVGNASHQINLQHTHTENAHTHSFTATGTTDAGGTAATSGPSVDSTDTSGGSTTGNESAHTHDMGHGHADTLAFTVDAHTHTGGTLAFRTFQVTTTDTGGGGVIFSAPNIYGPSGTTHANGFNAAAGANTVLGLPAAAVYADYPSPGGGGSVTAYFWTASGGSVGISGNADVNTTTKSGGVTAFAGNTGAGSAHAHSTPNHAHTLSNHTHNGPSHVHTFTSAGGTTGAQSDTGMSNSLSTTQSIQPRSIRVRYIVRIL